MVIYVEDSNATISEVLGNLQQIFSGVREARPSSGVGFALGGTIGPVAVIILTKDVPGPGGIQIHEFGTNKLGEALAELMLRLWEMIESQIGKREKLSSEKKEKLMNI